MDVVREHEPVAFFAVLEREDPGETFTQTNIQIPIFGNKDFFIGRSLACDHQFNDLSVSTKHLHITCIVFEEGGSDTSIAPLIYAQDLSTNGTFILRDFSRTERRLSRQDGRVLINSNDQLRISPKLALRFYYSATVVPNPNALTLRQQREIQLFADRYVVTSQKLGAGGFGQVFAARHKQSDMQLACKIMKVHWTQEQRYEQQQEMTGANDDPRMLYTRKEVRGRILKSAQFRECNILKDLSHPNVVHLEKVLWSTENIYIFQELVTGGDLFSYIEYQGCKVNDVDATVILLQILKGVEYLHDRDIVHRDLKPDNILVSSSVGAPLRVVITDFGSSRVIDPVQTKMRSLPAGKQRMMTVVGTVEYAAPEIYSSREGRANKKGYTKAIDMWSIGIIATGLLTGDVIFTNRRHPLFDENPKQVIIELSSRCDLSSLDSPWGDWANVRKRVKDLIRKLLVVDEEQRLDVKRALAHDLFTNKRFAAEMKAVYEKAIATWQPREKSVSVIEALDTSSLPPLPVVQNAHESAKSRYFPVVTDRDVLMDEMCQRNMVSMPKKQLGILPTIGEEVTPEPVGPPYPLTDEPMPPKHKSAGPINAWPETMETTDHPSFLKNIREESDGNDSIIDDGRDDYAVRPFPASNGLAERPFATDASKTFDKENHWFKTPQRTTKRPFEQQRQIDETYHDEIEIYNDSIDIFDEEYGRKRQRLL